MLTKDAANALLKTLEEPPSHVIFILATTDPDKLPLTIVSRCQKIVFQSPDIQTLAKQLAYVAEKEGKSIDSATSELIALHGKGSYRDALGVLEQVLTTQNKTISLEYVTEFLGVTDKEILLTLLTSVCKKDTQLLLQSFSTLQASSLSPLRAYDDCIEMIRLGLLSRVGEKGVVVTPAMTALAKEYPYVVSSKTILDLLTKRPLLEVSAVSSWTAFQAVMVGLTEEK
jgi:DNA polymerase-3 subunit gamma/tau